MDSRQPELSRLTLMCSDHEVAEFTWNHDRQAVTGKTHVLDAAHAPLMATDPSGNITRDRLSSWFKNRGITDFRPDAADRLRAVGYPSAASLMASGFGASLSDQYWIRPAGSASTWRDVNCFENDFSEELGELLLPHDASSVPSLIEKIRGNADLLASSPDAALNGNLPKRWTIEGGQRMLVKSGRSSGRFQEPFNEKIASVLCSRLLDEGDYVAYELEDGGFMKWTSRCKPMTDQVTEFVPAWALLCSSKRPSDLGLHDFYVSACAARAEQHRKDLLDCWGAHIDEETLQEGRRDHTAYQWCDLGFVPIAEARWRLTRYGGNSAWYYCSPWDVRYDPDRAKELLETGPREYDRLPDGRPYDGRPWWQA